jgi:hypothetical protein
VTNSQSAVQSSESSSLFLSAIERILFVKANEISLLEAGDPDMERTPVSVVRGRFIELARQKSAAAAPVCRSAATAAGADVDKLAGEQDIVIRGWAGSLHE